MNSTLLARFRVSRVLVEDTAVLYGGSVASGLIQYVALIVMARVLGPSRLGLVVLGTTIGSFAAAACELGIGPVLIRFRPQFERDDPVLWHAIVHLMARTAALAALVVLCGGGIVLSIAYALGHASGTVDAVGIGAAIAAVTIVFTFFQSHLQSARRFHSIAMLGIVSASARLIIIASLAAASGLTARTALATYLGVATAAALVAWMISLRPEGRTRVTADARKKAWTLARPYMQWTMVGRASAALTGNLGIFLLSGLSTARNIGVYGAASQTAAPGTMLGSAVGEVSFPHLVSRSRSTANRAILRRWSIWLAVLLMGGAIAAVVGVFLLPILLGPRFDPSTAPFAVLVCSYSLGVWLQPIGSLLYASDRQRRAAAIGAIQLALFATAATLLIPDHGALGVSIAYLITTIVSAPLIVVAALREPSASAIPDRIVRVQR